MFAGRIRKRKRARPVSAGMVETRLSNINTTINLNTECQPLHQVYNKYSIKPLDLAMEKNVACDLDLPSFTCAHIYK